MKKAIVLFFMFFGLNPAFYQIEKNIYELNATGNLLTHNVEEVLNAELKDKKVVFLGESNHYFGADLSAKAEFVKYLVLEKGYRDIAFEDDFLPFILTTIKNTCINSGPIPFSARNCSNF